MKWKLTVSTNIIGYCSNDIMMPLLQGQPSEMLMRLKSRDVMS